MAFGFVQLYNSQTIMDVRIEIDKDSGFCPGVVSAIKKAEEELEKSGKLFCLGDIVHNSQEVERLKRKGLITITHDDLKTLKNVKVLLRAHGEPPETYRIAKENGIEVIDATCPVVLKLQQRIKKSYNEPNNPQIVIYGKLGHAEVNGLVGQTDGNASVVENIDGVDNIDFSRDIVLYSQTTKSLEGLKQIENDIRSRNPKSGFECHDTICRQVANRMPRIRKFATEHELILFVSGKKSSNGMILFNECKAANSNTKIIYAEEDINPEWLNGVTTIGICGATSTPSWLMSNVKQKVSNILESL